MGLNGALPQLATTERSSSSSSFTLSFRRHSWRVHAEKGKLELRPLTRWTKKHVDAITAPRQLEPATEPYPVPGSTTAPYPLPA
eukprot:352982-Chlamydomonas_euryale.AAC.2